MAMNDQAPPPEHGGSSDGDLGKRMTAVEARLGVIEKTMVTAEVFERGLGAVRTEIGGLRGEMRNEIGGLRGEMRNEIGALRDEMHVEIGALRDEMHVDIGALRDEMRVEIGSVRVEIARIPFELVKWLVTLAGIATAIAATVYNLWLR